RRATSRDGRDARARHARAAPPRGRGPARDAVAGPQRAALSRRRLMPDKILVVVQRYGEEVTGGSESHARMLVERLALRREVEVATTTALDYWTWAPHYAAGIDTVAGVPVHRFAVERGRSVDYKDIERKVMLE